MAAQVQQGKPLALDEGRLTLLERHLAQRTLLHADALLQRIREACANERRPEHFTDYTHCCECAEHDETLRSHSVDTISDEQLGNPGWDPICFITEAGYRYYLPALARLVMETRGEYLDQFLFHLDRRRTAWLSAEQRAAVHAFLEAIAATWTDVLDESPTGYALLNVLERLANHTPP